MAGEASETHSSRVSASAHSRRPGAVRWPVGLGVGSPGPPGPLRWEVTPPWQVAPSPTGHARPPGAAERSRGHWPQKTQWPPRSPQALSEVLPRGRQVGEQQRHPAAPDVVGSRPVLSGGRAPGMGCLPPSPRSFSPSPPADGPGQGTCQVTCVAEGRRSSHGRRAHHTPAPPTVP